LLVGQKFSSGFSEWCYVAWISVFGWIEVHCVIVSVG
jgi:hypothetical protein